MKIKTSLQIATLICLQIAASAQPAQMQLLPGHVPAAVVGLQPLRHFDGTNHLRLAIGLPLRDKVGLTNLLQQLYDSTSPNYHHYLTAPQFAEQFGPTTADYQTLAAFAASHNLAVTGTHPNRVLLDVEGSVADIEKALHVTMRVYQHPTEQREFFAPDTEPAIDLSLPVLHISGLDNFVVPHTMSHKKTSLAQPAGATPATGSAPFGNYMGNDFRAAYVPGVTLTGAGQTVGLLEFDSGFYQSDITAYESLANLPNVPVTPVLLDGYNGGPGTIQNGNAEVSLDIEMAISMAPGLNQILVYEGSSTDDILSQMATDNVAKQIGASWSYYIDATSDEIFQQYAAQGQSFFNASGDGDAWVGEIYSPCDDPNITIVGGTTLSTSRPGGTWTSETVWNLNDGNGSGGGISSSYPIPPWQASVNMSANQGSTTQRNIPDVAMIANQIWVLYGDGEAGSFWGTSCATPLWAAFMALVNQQAVTNGTPTMGFINPAIYAIGQGATYTSCFHDITTGNNTSSSSPSEFYAVPGYDLCTGWGTPNGNSLINAFAPLGFNYTTDDGAVTITGYNGSGGAVIIPAAIGGMPVTTISSVAFNNCTNLTSITISSNVTSIAGPVLGVNGAFYNCVNLTSVTIPSSVASIGTGAFANCSNLTAVYCNGNAPTLGSSVFANDNNATLYYLYGATGWSSPFAGLPALSATASAQFTCTTNGGAITITHYSNVGGAVIIPDAINGLPVTGIASSAFQNCSNLTSVTIPGSVTSITGGALGGGVFENCTNLASVTLLNGVTVIAAAMFENCINLASITIPSSVTSIGNDAFENCAKLADVYFLGNAPTVSSSAYANANNVTNYYLPGATGWSSLFAGRPAVLWTPQIQTAGANFGVQNNQFGFNINWASGQNIVVQACTNLANPAWTPLQTNMITNGSFYFSEPIQTNTSGRFYRIVAP